MGKGFTKIRGNYCNYLVTNTRVKQDEPIDQYSTNFSLLLSIFIITI